MKLLFLGTAADDWSYEKPKDESEYRRRCSVLIDDVLLIDPGPQAVDACADFGKELTNIRYMINTHKHSDHFCQDTVETLEACGAKFIEIKEKEQKKIGKYSISAVKGNHGTCCDTVHFLISDGEHTLFYGLDGAWLLYDEVAAIKEACPDFAVFDATIGNIDGDYRIFEHNNLQMVREMKKTLQPYIKKFCISHMALTLHACHEELEAEMAKEEILVAYDGMEVEI